MTYAPHGLTLQTPLGMIRIEGDAKVVHSVRIGTEATTDDAPVGSPVATAARQLSEYFAGARQSFDLPLAPLGSERGMALRQGMVDIPYGETVTYGGLAKILASAPRAVGQACRRNPMPIIIPCHRVTSSSGPEYYSGGNGPQTKAWLINFEADISGQRSRLL